MRERLERLGEDMFITDYAGDIVNLLVNKPQEYRFLYDAQADLYMICDAWDYIHLDMVAVAFREGWYQAQKDFINEFVCDYSTRYDCSDAYFDIGCNLGFEPDEDDERDFSLINGDYDDSFVYPWIYCFAFVPADAQDNSKDALRGDGYEHEYKFSFGTVYTRNFDLKECSDMKNALSRADR